jgi:hypothetical protein
MLVPHGLGKELVGRPGTQRQQKSTSFSVEGFPIQSEMKFVNLGIGEVYKIQHGNLGITKLMFFLLIKKKMFQKTNINIKANKQNLNT